MRRFLFLGILLVLTGSFAAQQPPPQKGAGPGKPLEPKDAQKLFKLDSGLRIELVACEPQIESPVALQFDPDGRLWVVEMRDYPNGPGKGEKPAGRIRVLEDKDGDGFFETSTIWADNLLFANGLLLWKDGAIVTMAPKITHLRDTKGQGRADKEEILYEGFAALNPQLRVSHPILGLDGWIYCANGLRGGTAIRAGDASAKPISLSGMDFRFDPVHLAKYEAISGPGQYGNTFDEWGNRFVCDNRHHLRHVVMEDRYIKRNPYLAAPALLEDISVLDDGPLSSGGKVYPLSKNWTTSSLHEGRFTAACGVFIYHGGLLDTSRDRKGAPFYRGAALTCEPTGNLVHMEILTPKGATFSATPHKKGVEFLATTDDWFRPVFLNHGPDGALYVVDMYRAVIEHPEFMPPELKNRPDLWAGKDKGRIWRIVPEGHQTKTPRPGLSKATIPELVKLLEHAEPWYRQTAQRLLLERDDKAMIEPLTKMLKETKSPHAKILGAWMLERQGKIREEQLLKLFYDEHARVREQGIRIAEFNPVTHFINESFVFRNSDVDRRVRYQAALFWGSKLRFDDDFRPGDDDFLASNVGFLAFENSDDNWIRLAALSAPPKFAGKLVDLVLHPKIKSKAHAEMVRELCVIVGAQKDAKLYDWVSGTVRYEKLPPHIRKAGFVGLAEGLQRRGATLLSATKEVNQPEHYLPALKMLFAEAANDVRNPKVSHDERLLSAKLLTQAPWPTAKESLVPLVEKEPNTDLRIAALRALAAQQDKEVPPLLMKLWAGSSPMLRREILEAMLRQPARIPVLLDEIESGRMKASEIDPLRTKQLSNHKDAAIRERAKKLLAGNLPADRQKVVAEYQAALKLKGDATLGRKIFEKNCATCHRVAGLGVDVGPDIADTRTKAEAALMFDILAPNAAIDANYINYVVATKDGRILTGMLALETASSITIKRAENQMDVVLRKDIDEIASTGISLMPEGFEKQINVQEMAHLLRFLKDWRYLDGSVPLPK